jgi:hypothetical protein
MSVRARRIARSREEMLGLLADFSGDGDDSDRELSFSDIVDAHSRPPNAGQVPTALPTAVAAEEEAVTSKQRHWERRGGYGGGGATARGAAGAAGTACCSTSTCLGCSLKASLNVAKTG